MITSKDIHGNRYELTVDELSWRPSAYGIVIKDKRILLVKEFGKYHLPGGGVDLGEDPKNAVLREVTEETGIIASDPKLLEVNSAFFSWESTDEPGEMTHDHCIMLYYACEYVDSDMSKIHLDEFEQGSGLTAEWVDTATLNDIIVGTSVDWRDIVHQALASTDNRD